MDKFEIRSELARRWLDGTTPQGYPTERGSSAAGRMTGWETNYGASEITY